MSSPFVRRGQYQLFTDDVHILGRGTFGTVFSAVHNETGVPFAVKVIAKNTFTENMEIITREINLLHRLRGTDNIIHLIEYFEDEYGDLFLVFEYANVGTLTDVLRQCHHLLEVEAKMLFCQIVSGLKTLHSRQIVHGDIKMDNILVFANKDQLVVKIGDFGFSRKSSSNSEPPPIIINGSPTYMAPEMTTGQLYDGFKADIWSLGVTLYCMVFSQYPFCSLAHGTPQEEIADLFQQIRMEAPDFSPFPTSPTLLDLFKRLFEKDPAKRIALVEIQVHPWCTMMDLRQEAQNKQQLQQQE